MRQDGTRGGSGSPVDWLERLVGLLGAMLSEAQTCVILSRKARKYAESARGHLVGEAREGLWHGWRETVESAASGVVSFLSDRDPRLASDVRRMLVDILGARRRARSVRAFAGATVASVSRSRGSLAGSDLAEATRLAAEGVAHARRALLHSDRSIRRLRPMVRALRRVSDNGWNPWLVTLAKREYTHRTRPLPPKARLHHTAQPRPSSKGGAPAYLIDFLARESPPR